jgi:arylsulfatase A-like enzyme
MTLNKKKINLKLNPFILKLVLVYFFIIHSIVLLELSALMDYSKFQTTLSEQAFSNGVIIKSIVFYILSNLLLHLTLAWLASLVSHSIITHFKIVIKRQVLLCHLTVLSLMILLIHSVNGYLYANSAFGIALEEEALQKLIIILSILLLALPLLNIKQLLLSVLTCKKRAFGAITVIMSAFILPLFFAPQSVHSFSPRFSSEKPNIIIIGVDSLRPEFASNKSIMPFLSKQLEQSTTFENTYTPLARTFPSWVSILSGRYPLNTGARVNLVDSGSISNKDQLMTYKLKSKGYSSLYAIDERLFNNIDESYGFDIVSGPKYGASDFLLSKFNDIPLANIVINTPLGSLLYPYNKNNRASYKTYIPSNFAHQTADLLSTLPKENPIFFATHFCLAHSPFVWAKYKETSDSFSHYLEGLTEIDEQIKTVISESVNLGLLDNAIVIYLSDHGEGFADQDTPVIENTHSYGHGTDISSLEQIKVLLAFQVYENGKIVNQFGKTKQIASLIDVKPTILDLLNDDVEDEYDGISLKRWVTDTISPTIDRNIYLESGFVLPALLSKKPDLAELAKAGMSFYNIDDKGRLYVKDATILEVMKDKQFGLVNNSFLVVSKYQWNKRHYQIYDLEKKKLIDQDEYLDTHYKLISEVEQNFKITPLEVNSAN